MLVYLTMGCLGGGQAWKPHGAIAQTVVLQGEWLSGRLAVLEDFLRHLGTP